MLRQLFFSATALPTKIRIIPSTPATPDTPSKMWVRYYSKWVATTSNGKTVKRNVIANSHNGERPVPDLLYYYMINLDKPELKASASDVVTVLVLENFHQIKAGETKGGRAYYNYSRCTSVPDRFGRPTHCDECAKGTPKKFGRKLHMTMWPSQREAFEAELLSLSSRCVGCNRGEISVYGYECAACKKTIASHYDGVISPDEEAALRESEVTCPHCGHTAAAVSMIECVIRHGEGDAATFTQGCTSPTLPEQVPNPWDYDLTVVEEVVGNGSRMVVTKFEPAQKYELEDGLETPFDFLFFQYMTLEDQAKALGRKNVFDDKAQELLDAYFAPPEAPQAAPSEPDAQSIPWGRRRGPG